MTMLLFSTGLIGTMVYRRLCCRGVTCSSFDKKG